MSKSDQARMMKLTRQLFLGRVYSSLNEHELELVEYAIEQKWLKVEEEVNVRVIVQGESKFRGLVALDQTPEERIETPDHQPSHRVIWPDDCLVSGDQLMRWANDDVDNGEHPGPKPRDAQEAIEILKETGSVTFGDEI